MRYTEEIGLSATQKSLLVATPVLVGSVGRILTGALTDRFGGRIMFPVLLVLTAPFVLLVALAGNMDSYPLLLVFGFFLGIAGTTFAVGIPFVNAWYETSRRGFATGVFGAGMGGTALSAFFTPRFVNWFGYTQTHVIIAAALVATAAVDLVDDARVAAVAPQHRSRRPQAGRRGEAARHVADVVPVRRHVRRLRRVLHLPADLPQGRLRLRPHRAPAPAPPASRSPRSSPGRSAACCPTGSAPGRSCRRRSPAPPSWPSWSRSQPAPEMPAGLSFVMMAAFLGLGTGGVFAWVALTAPADRVGSVTGIVGAAGGLGGFFPPLVMGATYDEADHSYTIGLVLLCVVATLALLFTLFGIRKRVPDRP